MSILNDPWFIGIGGGVLSGLIVTFISRVLLSRRDQREYAQKVLGANREIVYAVRPGISEGLVPTADILDALAEATARKFGIDRKDLYRPYEIAQELMKEVMDSSFISAKIKEDHCARLGVLANPKPFLSSVDVMISSSEEKYRRPSGVEEYRSRMVSMVSVTMGVLAATMTLVFALSKDGPFPAIAAGSKDILTTLLIPAIATMGAVMVSVIAMWSTREFRHRLAQRERNSEMKGTRLETKSNSSS